MLPDSSFSFSCGDFSVTGDDVTSLVEHLMSMGDKRQRVGISMVGHEFSPKLSAKETLDLFASLPVGGDPINAFLMRINSLVRLD